MRRRTAIASLLAGALAAPAGAAHGAQVPAGWAPAGLPSTPLREQLAGDRDPARRMCGENAALLFRVGPPRALRRWSARTGDRLVAKGWSVRDLQGAGAAPDRVRVRDRLAGAAARCPERRIVVRASPAAVAALGWAVQRLAPEQRERIAAAAGELSSWPEATIDEALAGLPQRGRQLGSSTAPVVVHQFVDLQCPFCRDFGRDALPRLVARYVRSGEVRMVLDPVAFIGEDSLRAARFALAVGQQDRIWPFAARFLERQGPQNSGYATDAFLRDVGAMVPGLDVDAAFAAWRGRAVAAALRRSDRLARRLGYRSVPSLAIGPAGGRLRVFAGDWARPSSVEGAIQRALARAADPDG